MHGLANSICKSVQRVLLVNGSLVGCRSQSNGVAEYLAGAPGKTARSSEVSKEPLLSEEPRSTSARSNVEQSRNRKESTALFPSSGPSSCDTVLDSAFHTSFAAFSTHKLFCARAHGKMVTDGLLRAYSAYHWRKVSVERPP